MLTKSKVEKIHADLDKAMQEVAAKHGLTMSPTRITFNAQTFKMSAEFGDTAEIGTADPKFSNHMKNYGFIYNLTVNDIGMKVDINKLGTVTILGMGSRKSVIVKTVNNNLYSFPVQAFAEKLGRSQVPNPVINKLIVVPIPHVPTKD